MIEYIFMGESGFFVAKNFAVDAETKSEAEEKKQHEKLLNA